jgi:hypothetical protein
MATKKADIPADEKLDNQELKLFEVLGAIDKKDYGYFDRLSQEQQKKLAFKVLVDWTSAIKASGQLQGYYLRSVDYHANMHLFNDRVMKHPKLLWLMLCASSPGLGTQFHQWIPNISSKVSSLTEDANLADTKKYYTKIYPGAGTEAVDEISKEFVKEQRRKRHLAKIYPNLKLTDVETLSQLISDEEINQYEADRGN